MSPSIQDATRKTVLDLLRPVIQLLLKARLGIGDLTDLAQIAYVREALEQAREAGHELQRPNVTRIAVATGLTRAQVASLLKAGDPLSRHTDRGRHRAERVLNGWWNDDAFQDDAGSPAVLPLKGGTRSFAALCHRYSGDTRPSAILDELLRAGAARKLRNGKLQALSRTCATIAWDPEGLASLSEQLGEHADTLLHNLEATHRPRYARRVVNLSLDPRYAPVLIRDIERQADVLLEMVDDALNDPQHTLKAGGTGRRLSLGLGVYLIEQSGSPPGSAKSVRAVHAPQKKKRGRRE